jgi:hypothetical protein
MLIVTCVTVGALFMVFVTQQLKLAEFAVPVTPVAMGGGGGAGGDPNHPEDSADVTPGSEETTAFDEPQFQETLTALASAVNSRTSDLASDTLDVADEAAEGRGDRRSPGAGGGRGGGIGGGIGSGFGPGRGGPPEPRREIRFEPANVLEYAQWLDYFKIELGILGQDNKVYYAYNLSKQKPEVRVGEPAQESRLYMNPTDSQFAALDRKLVEKAGIGDKGRIILQFYPPEAEAILKGLEQKQAGGRKPETIRGTVFRVTRKGNAFEFSVIDQTYR